MQLTNEQLISFELIKIDSIENVGMKNCVDIQVEDDESFTLGNGIISHNSALGGISKVLGNKNINYYVLRGKPLNSWEISHQKFASNKELSELYQIIKADEFSRIIVASDQDLDGIHINSLLIAFIEKYLPEYKDRLYRLNTPVKANKKNNKLTSWVYDLNEELPIKSGESQAYYKGLGTWPKEDLEQVIETDGLEKMLMKFEFDSKDIIDDFMSDKKSDVRKEYILNNEFSIAKI